MTIDIGRVPDGTGLSSATEPPSAGSLRPSGFDPSRYEGKPRWLPRKLQGVLRSFVDPLFERVSAMSNNELRELIRACRQVSPINCGWDEYTMASLLYESAAQELSDRDRHPEGDETRSGSVERGEIEPGPKASPNPLSSQDNNNE